MAGGRVRPEEVQCAVRACVEQLTGRPADAGGLVQGEGKNV